MKMAILNLTPIISEIDCGFDSIKFLDSLGKRLNSHNFVETFPEQVSFVLFL